MTGQAAVAKAQFGQQLEECILCRSLKPCSYMAPELFNQEEPRTDRSDIYALSITIWEVSIGLVVVDRCVIGMLAQVFALKLPFSDHIRDTFELIVRVARGERPTKPDGCENVGFTDDLWDLMQRGWSAEPMSRPSLPEFVEVLQTQRY
jgi:hypothetical protein